jgi:UDP-N-acetylmuramyl pentapeptide synthase
MRLSDLMQGMDKVEAGDVDVTGCHDNRKVAPGNVFGAFVGATVNGEDFIEQAVKAGAVAVVARPQARADIEAAGAIALSMKTRVVPLPVWPRLSLRPCPKPWWPLRAPWQDQHG